LRAEYRDDVITVLTKHLQSLTEPVPQDRAPEAQARPMLPPLTPADDLAINPPGKSIRDLLDESGPGLMERVVSRPLRRPSEWDPWRKGLAGEWRVGAELNRLGRQGWRVLHSIPLANKVEIDHLLIGPGGVFTVNTKHHYKRAVWIGDDSVKVDHGVTELQVFATQLDVRVYQEPQVSALGQLSGVLTADQVEQVYSVARHRQAWAQA
jgi:hypothetical protein